MVKESKSDQQNNNNVQIKSVEKKQAQEISRPEFEEKIENYPHGNTIINEFKVIERDSSEKYQVNPTGINDTPREISSKTKVKAQRDACTSQSKVKCPKSSIFCCIGR